MPLILAIVADPQEAAQLAALIQGRLSVDLIQAAEVGEGLLALDDRIPDLILTSPLMSPFDDGVLDEYLRDLGPGGAHVQTLRIPVLSQAPKKKQRLVFSLRRRSKPVNPALEGCEPKVFADEIEQYLVRAAEEKRHASANETPAIVAEGSTDDLTPISEVQWTPAYSPDAPSENVVWSAPEAEPEPLAWRADLEPEPQAETMEVEEPLPVAVVEAFRPAAVEEIAAAAAEESEIVETVVAEAAVVESLTVATVEPVRLATVATAEAEEDARKATPSFKAALAAIRAAWGKPSPSQATPAPSAREELAPIEVDLTDAVDVLDEELVVAREDVSDVYELSVEPDMEELESQLLTPLPPKPAPPPVEPRKVEARPSAELKGDRRRKSKRGEKAAAPQPAKAQDEWGIFDPNRCGFAALVDTLDKVSDEKPEQPPRNGSKARVISCS